MYLQFNNYTAEWINKAQYYFAVQGVDKPAVSIKYFKLIIIYLSVLDQFKNLFS